MYTPIENGGYHQQVYSCHTYVDTGETKWTSKEKTVEKKHLTIRDFVSEYFEVMFEVPTADMYDYFVYEDETRSYVYEVESVQLWGKETFYVRMSISFLDGKVNGFRLLYIGDYGDEYRCELIYKLSKYNTTHITVPDDIPSAA